MPTLGITENTGQELSQLIASDVHQLKSIVIASGAGVLSRGTILGQIRAALGTPVAGSNTGDGTIGSVSLGGEAQHGDYKLVCTAAATDGGTFKVVAPDGSRLDDASVGVAYSSKHINFTISDGSTDFAEADSFTVPVDLGSMEYKQLDLAGVDGTQKPRAILIADIDATSAAVTVYVYLVGTYRASDLIWPDGITADQKNEAILSLQDQGIILV